MVVEPACFLVQYFKWTESAFELIICWLIVVKQAAYY